MANFATLANVLAGAVIQVTSDSTTKTRGSNSLMPLAGTCASASRAKRVGANTDWTVLLIAILPAPIMLLARSRFQGRSSRSYP